MRKILFIMVVFFALKQFTATAEIGSFLRESTNFEEASGEAVHPAETGGAQHEEGEGIELHYSFGTKGFWICVGVSIFLTCFAGIMSGLTVGLLSIDTLELEMKLIHGTDEQKKLAAEVLPLLNRHHYLLVTLLLCNAFAMEALPIFLDAIVPAAWAIIISVTAVLFFGEIIPQAVCTGPQQLKIASCVAPSVNFLMIAVGIVAYPISKILDWLLGEHHAIRYTNNDLKALIELHSYAALQETIGDNTISGFGLQSYQTKMIQGAIDIQRHKVKDIMIPFDRMCSIRIGKKMDFKRAKNYASFSRIPVYMRRDKHAIIGFMLIKSLVGVDLSQGKTINQLINDSDITLRKPLYVSPNDDIGPLLTRFKNGRSHMAIVTDNIKEMEANMKKFLDNDGSVIEEEDENDYKESERKPKVLGIITLEDVIESALKEDILDEADYDLENNPNLDIKALDQSGIEPQLITPPNPAFTKNNIHAIIKKKVENRLGRKGSDLMSSNTMNKQWFEMNDMSESLLDKKGGGNLNKHEILRQQLQHPEMSKSYSFMKRQNKI